MLEMIPALVTIATAVGPLLTTILAHRYGVVDLGASGGKPAAPDAQPAPAASGHPILARIAQLLGVVVPQPQPQPSAQPAPAEGGLLGQLEALAVQLLIARMRGGQLGVDIKAAAPVLRQLLDQIDPPQK